MTLSGQLKYLLNKKNIIINNLPNIGQLPKSLNVFIDHYKILLNFL